MKKILIVGAGSEQVQAIEVAKEMGYYVVCTDFDKEAPGITIADKFYNVSTDDFEGTLTVAKDENIDGIMTVCSETAVPVIGKICDVLGLPGISYKTGMQATNKGYMRAAIEQYGVDMPARWLISDLDEAYKFCEKFHGPWVFKPSDSSGQRGTTYIQNKSEIVDAFDIAKKEATDGKVLIDQFVQGQEINVCAVVKNSEITILSLADRDTLPPPHFGIAVLHSAPPSTTREETDLVRQMAMDSIVAIGLKNGIGYPQIIVTKDGPKFIEIAARMPGGHNREMALYLSGVDMVKAQILISLGEEFEIHDIREKNIYPAASVKLFTELNFPDVKGNVSRVEGTERVKAIDGVKDCYINLEIGKPIPPLTFSGGRFGAVITVGDSKETTLALNEKCANLLIVE